MKNSILDKLENARVFKVYRKDDTLCFIEKCDEYYEERLTKDEMYKLIEELTYMANNLP